MISPDNKKDHKVCYSSVRIPNLPSFRGSDTGSIADAFEFLGKIKAILLANDVPDKKWFAALLTTLKSFDRQWCEKNLKGLAWDKVELGFLHHFESPAIRESLVLDLMTIRKRSNESVQEYSDRFTSLMARTGKTDDDETLVSKYI